MRIELIDVQMWSEETIGVAEVEVDRELEVNIYRKVSKVTTARVVRRGNNIGEVVLEVEWEPVPREAVSLQERGRNQDYYQQQYGRGSLPNQPISQKEPEPPIDPRRQVNPQSNRKQ